MADFIPEVKCLLRRLMLPFECHRITTADGNCFFHGLIDQFRRPGVKETLSLRVAGITDYVTLRHDVLKFMQYDKDLQAVEGFITQKNNILQTGKTWKSYLSEMRQNGKDADEFLIWCTALFVGKDIMLASDSPQSTKETPWTKNPGTVEDSIFTSSYPPLTLAYLTQRHFQSIESWPPEENRCIGCGWKGSRIRAHISHPNNQKKHCKIFYDIDELQTKATEKRKEQQREAMRRDYETNKEEKRESSRSYYESHKTERKESSRSYYESHKPERRESMRSYDKEHREEQKQKRTQRRIINFANEDESKRFKTFKENMKDTWCYTCICCHRMQSSSGARPFPGGIKSLQERVNKEVPGLFEKSIEIPPPKECFDEARIYICSHCYKFLFVKKKRPRYSTKNGLFCDVIPPQLKDLNDLTATLIAKRIVFLKIFHLRTSRYPAVVDKAVNIMILDDDILNTMNSIKSFPRRPDDAGLIPVQLKRRMKYKNKVFQAYVDPAVLTEALKKLKELGHPGYQDIQIDSSNYETEESVWVSEDEDDPSSDASSSDSEVEADYIKKHQYDVGGETALTASFPEASLVVNQGKEAIEKKQRIESKSGVTVAPGECKIPTNVLRDDTWDTDGWPQLHPTGKFGLHHPREDKITPQEYFLHRIMNVDRRWCRNKPYVFAALNYIERHHLESQINISYRRGKVQSGKLVNFEDLFMIFDNTVGSPRYWQQKRYEVVAKLEQLGAFQFFFTLSCADKRWDETFVAILKQRGLKISYSKRDDSSNKEQSKYSYQADEILVQEGNKEAVPLDEYMANERLHDLIKENVLTLTMVFNKRVQNFMKDIVRSPSSPMHVKYYHYRVEFQARGAGHIHGVLWINLDTVKKNFPGLDNIMNKLKGSSQLSKDEREITASFVDSFITCSLDDPGTRDIVQEVQKHSHRETCKKKGNSCRFGFPRYPSERTIIAQPLHEDDYPTEEAFKESKARYKKILSDVKEVLQQLDEEELQTLTLADILSRAGVQSQDYHEALGVSQTGSCVILKRKPSEIFINNYNPEWIKAWNGNMDIQAPLDFFAVITYITDYYTKAEPVMTLALKDAAKQCRGKGKKEQLRFMAQAFMTHRQMGECEAYYRMIPSLHLSQSNLKCVFVATGFPWNRSKFLAKVEEAGKDKILDVNPGECDVEEVDQDERGKWPSKTIEIPGHEGHFRPAPPIHEKYACRPKSLENMCLAQFAISFDPARGKLEKDEESVAEDLEISSDQRIVSWNPDHEVPLPSKIKLSKNLGLMRLRGHQAILRMHKFREDRDPHEYFYSDLVLYRPWRNEKELHPKDFEACLQLFLETDDGEALKKEEDRRSKIEKTKEKLFPHRNNVEEARAVLETLPEQRPQHIGDQLDAENELENDEPEMDDEVQDDEYAARDPQHLKNLTEDESSNQEKTVYRRIDISNKEAMAKSVQMQDPEQRMFFDVFIKFAKQTRTSEKCGIARPKPPLLKLHGGAGSGKSKLINDISSWTEYWMSVYNDKDPDCPSVVKAAFTGKASGNIKGATLHSAFRLPFGNSHFAMPDNLRQTLWKQLANLTLVIIDEMSMVKADMLYQLSLRLQEITQCNNDFGGVSVALCGDLMQLQPVFARWIFDEPASPEFAASYDLHSLWDQFQAIELLKNHRQGNDKDFGDLLNRLRVGEQTEEDIKILKKRITKKFPDDAFFIYGKRDLVHAHNSRELARIPGPAEVMKAYHIHPNKKNFKPKPRDDGTVGNTSFLDELLLKIGAKVMMIHNVDTADLLTNGTTGVVLGFVKDKDIVIKVLVEFDEPEAGEALRSKHRRRLTSLNMTEATPVGRISFEYSMGKAVKQHTAKYKVIQFPLNLASAMTCHKVQGMNIKSPNSVVVDCNSGFCSGWTYVALGRVQNIQQLHLKSFDEKDIMVSTRALEEKNKIWDSALNNPKNQLDNQPENIWRRHDESVSKISSLNIQSLPGHLNDLKADHTLMKSDVICLQETFRMRSDGSPRLPGYTCFLAGEGRGRGVGAFVKNDIMEYLKVVKRYADKDYFQGNQNIFFHLFIVF